MMMIEDLKGYVEAIEANWNEDRVTGERPIVLTVEEGRTYFKIVRNSGSGHSVHSFVVKNDTKKFRKGDILKAASWNAPAKNFARGNVYGNYANVRWTGW